jgi:invasion protein IalB
MIGRRVAVALLAQILSLPALAQPTEQKPAPAPVSAEPQTTTASFGDWTLRCQRVGEPEKAVKLCEIVLTIQGGQQQQAIAEVAMGRVSKTEPVHLTAHLPINISLPSTVKFSLGEKDAHPQELNWRRCAPVGCFADAALTEAQWKALRGQSDPGSIEFTDSVGRPVKLPVSSRGLPQAIDALAKE